MLLNLESVPQFYKNYVKQIEESDVLQALRLSGFRSQVLIHSISADKIDHRYAEGKWTIRELLCHILDAERIFAYRALRFAGTTKPICIPSTKTAMLRRQTQAGVALKRSPTNSHTSGLRPSICSKDSPKRCCTDAGPLTTTRSVFSHWVCDRRA